MSDYDYEADEVMAKNQIWFKVENQTGFQLTAQSCFADWGDFAEPPSSVRNPPASWGFFLTLSNRLQLIVRDLVDMLSPLRARSLAQLEWWAIKSQRVLRPYIFDFLDRIPT